MSQFRNQLLPFLETARPTYLEYIECYGEQYIDSGLNGTLNTSVSMTLKLADTVTDTAMVYGARTSASSKNLSCQFAPSSVGFVLDFCNYNDSRLVYNGDFVHQKLILFNSKDKRTISYNGSVISSDTRVVSTSFQTDNTLLVGSAHSDLNYKGFVGKIYSCQIYDGTTMVRNFRPCLSGENGEPCMWDTVTQKYYYNGGTGKFGYEKTFLELDYIESDSNQYIDTGIVPSAITEIYASGKINANRNPPTGHFLTAYDTGQSGVPMLYLANFNNDSNQLAIGTREVYQNFDYQFGEVFTIRLKTLLNGIEGTFNSESFSASGAMAIPQTTIRLFCYNNGSTNNRVTAGTFYFASISKDSVMVFDAIPAYRFDGTICLYDFISGSYKEITLGSSGYLKGQFTDRGKVYEILPYIQSNSRETADAAYIDTGIKLRGDYILSCNFTMPSNTTGNYAILGASNGTTYSGGEIALFWNDSRPHKFEEVYPTTNTTSVVLLGPSYTSDSCWKFIRNGNGGSSYNGTLFSHASEYTDYVGNNNIYISATNRYPSLWCGNAKFHYYKLQYRDGGVQQELVPVRGDGVTGMYDTVSKQVLGNANTTGVFIAPNILPDGYTQIEYIQNTADSYIDTGITSVPNMRIDMVVQSLQNSNLNAPFVCLRKTETDRRNGFYYWYTSSNQQKGFSIESASSTQNITYTEDIMKKTLLINSDGTLTMDNRTTTDAAYLGEIRLMRNANTRYMKCRFYSIAFYVNNYCIGSFIPCKNSSNVAGMYDTVREIFLTTPSGTTAFTAGPVITV